MMIYGRKGRKEETREEEKRENNERETETLGDQSRIRRREDSWESLLILAVTDKRAIGTIRWDDRKYR